MRYVVFKIVVAWGMVMGVAKLASAQSRPLEQLPKDVAKWSTVWVEVPKQMYEVGKDDGPLAALTWGSAKGTAVMIDSTTKDLWNAWKPDEKPGHESTADDDVTGPLFRYEF